MTSAQCHEETHPLVRSSVRRWTTQRQSSLHGVAKALGTQVHTEATLTLSATPRQVRIGARADGDTRNVARSAPTSPETMEGCEGSRARELLHTMFVISGVRGSRAEAFLDSARGAEAFFEDAPEAEALFEDVPRAEAFLGSYEHMREARSSAMSMGCGSVLLRETALPSRPRRTETADMIGTSSSWHRSRVVDLPFSTLQWSTACPAAMRGQLGALRFPCRVLASPLRESAAECAFADPTASTEMRPRGTWWRCRTSLMSAWRGS